MEVEYQGNKLSSHGGVEEVGQVSKANIAARSLNDAGWRNKHLITETNT